MPSRNYRYNAFQDALNAVTVTDEPHIISSSSPYIIQLCEAPKKDTPSTISLKIDGVAAEEVAAYPAQGQYWPDYSTNADGNEQWNTGTILFNSADAGKAVTVTYKATGSIVWAEKINTYYFWETGSIVAPHWAKYAFLSGCAGGGGGGGRDSAGTAGGVTSFGSLLSLGGGGGGGGRGLIHGDKEAGANGNTRAGLVPADGGYYLDRNGDVEYRGGAGGSGPFGQGGEARYIIDGDGNNAISRGGGGGGALSAGGGGGCGGGGAGGACIDHRIAIEGGELYVITVGLGGTGGGGSQSGGNGMQGLLIVRWGA